MFQGQYKTIIVPPTKVISGILVNFFLKKDVQRSKPNEKNANSVFGFENWFHLIPTKKNESYIYLLDFKPHFFEEKNEKNNYSSFDEISNIEEFDEGEDEEFFDEEFQNDQYTSKRTKKQEISGITIFFLIETPKGFEKYRSFIRFNPYFYLLLKEGITEDQINKIIWEINEIGNYHIKEVTKTRLYDANDLVFPEKKVFLRIETYVPNSVSFLRERLEKIHNVEEWREADILYHRRAAIDLDLRIGLWYKAYFRNQECLQVTKATDKVKTPPMNIFAYDIETNNPRNEQPDPNKHNISMLSYFNDFNNAVLINSEVVDTTSVNDFFVITRKTDDQNEKPWIDYCSIDKTEEENSNILKIDLVQSLQKILKESRKSPIENLPKIKAKLKEINPVEKIDILLKFLPQILNGNPGILEFIKKIYYFVKVQNQLEKDSTIIDFVPMKAIICKSEKELIEHFLEVLDLEKPEILTDFNGNKFDLPFIQARSEILKIPFLERTGLKFTPKIGIKDKEIVNWLRDVDGVESYGYLYLDAYLWTLKYSYLPKGMQGLKPAVRSKLKIIPIGRDALWQLNENSEGNSSEAVAYAGSDSYVTWLYTKKIILDFVISMGNIFPVTGNELLSVNAGTLDDLLIDAISHHNEIVALKRYKQEGIGYLSDSLNVESVTYTGGFVDSPNPGIWRKDIPYKLNIDTNFIKNLREELPDLLSKVEKNKLTQAKKTYFLEKLQSVFTDQDQYFAFEDLVSSKALEGVYEEAREKLSDNSELVEKYYNNALSLEIIDSKKNKELLLNQVSTLEEPDEYLNGNVIHLDVTSMYPSQIRQYKIQPSGIVDKSYCNSCTHREEEENGFGVPICAFESSWTAKANLRKPCEHKIKDKSNKYPKGICSLKRDKKFIIKGINNDKKNYGCDYSLGLESTCPLYSMGRLKDIKSYEFFKKSNDQLLKAYKLEYNQFIEVPLETTFLAKGFRSKKNVVDLSSKILTNFKEWVQSAISGAEINFSEDNPFIIDGGNGTNFEWDGFLVLDVSQKNSSLLISLKNRFCQKAYDHVAAIMDDFFQLRVHHKHEMKRIKRIIREKSKRNEVIPEEMENKVKFHDSTQLGLKVPLNSIYGLLGMKGGVHNASPPSAGVTTSLSVKLIKWAANYLKGLGPITELDTDGVWIFIPKIFPTHFSLKIGKKDNTNEGNTIGYKEENINLLEAILNDKMEKNFEHKNYWSNNHHSGIEKASSRNLFKFEQDGPYSFQYVQGKKKYIVYNRSKVGKWDLEELTGLETKRRDFSKLHKEIQELIIQSFLEDYENGTTLKKLYLNALKNVDGYIEKILNGGFDDSYFVIPKSINSPLENYRSIGPDVTTGFILRDDFGFSIEPGSTVEFYYINPVKDKKTGSNLVVIPKIFFETDINDAKKFLKSHGIGYYTDINSMNDIRKHLIKIDYNKYINELIGPGKIVDRMITTVASRQNLPNLNKPSSKDLSEFFTNKASKKAKNKNLSTNGKKKIDDQIPKIEPDTFPISKNNSVKNGEKKLNENQLLSEIKILIENEEFSAKEESTAPVFGSFIDYLEKIATNEESTYVCPICKQNFAQHQCLPGNLCPYCHIQTLSTHY
jgi:DNA polymerase elongation subunit (family B)/DNA-directed RNA polymerase subunit RPC12/RpoP